MPAYTVSFVTRRQDSMELPAHLIHSGGEYRVEPGPGGGIAILGNRDGLLYLAEVLIRAAIGEYDQEFHLHLPLDSRREGPNTDARPELTIYAAQKRP
jgi:hypothetical protein